jgi:hypothetical protein
MQTAICIDLLFVNGFDGFACKKPRFNAGVHLARRRNNSACCLLALRMSFLASSMGSVSTGVSVGGGTVGCVGVRGPWQGEWQNGSAAGAIILLCVRI